MRKGNKTNKVRIITMSAFSLALSVICLIMFRGTISIISAFLIPAIIVLLSKRNPPSYFIFSGIGLIIITLFFFQTQIIFVTGYIALSVTLRILCVTHDIKVIFKPFYLFLYILSAVVVLFLSIKFTEILFLVPLHAMMLKLSGYNPLYYFLILFIEGVFICLLNITILNTLSSKIT